jgi:glutaredoxin 3
LIAVHGRHIVVRIIGAATLQENSAIMADVVIYTTPTCPYCQRARRLLDGKGVAFRDIDVSRDPSLREEMTGRAQGRTTVPQVFIDGTPYGGCDDIHALDAQGRLDPLLGLN